MPQKFEKIFLVDLTSFQILRLSHNILNLQKINVYIIYILYGTWKEENLGFFSIKSFKKINITCMYVRFKSQDFFHVPLSELGY